MKILCKNINWKLNEDYNIDKILYLLIDRPNRINSFGIFVWENKNGYNRNYNLPSFISINGYVEWYKNNLSQKVKKPIKIL